MSILDIAKQRFSVRNYLDKEISQETLETILETGTTDSKATDNYSRNYRLFQKMFEGEGDKKKKVYPACPICWARRIHLIIYR